VSGTLCRNGPEGASHKRHLTPLFPESRKAIEIIKKRSRLTVSAAGRFNVIVSSLPPASPAATIQRSGFATGAVIGALVVAAVTAGVFLPVLGFQFVPMWDDNLHVLRNPLLHPVTREHLAQFWTEPYGQLYYPVVYTVWAG